MSIVTIRRLLEVRLNANAGGLPIAFENVPYQPTQGTAYQRCTLLPAQSDNPTMGTAHYRQPGIFQVSLFYPQSVGPASASARAEALRAIFPRGLSLEDAGVRVLVASTPSISSGNNVEGWFTLTVSIPFTADIG